MKAASLLVLFALCSCKTQPKNITVAFNGSHGKVYLNQGCEVLQREHERFSKLSSKEWAALYSLTGKSHMSCLFEADVMNRGVENQLLSAFASNPRCQGVRFAQGYYGPKESTPDAEVQFASSDWRLSLDLTPSDQTGEVSLAESQWTLNPREFKSISGTLANIEKASTDVCTIVKGQGGQI
jgi:hypothetical protein